MIGYHYSSAEIPLGSIIKGTTVRDATWNVYKQVADSMGLYFPREFGFAYYNRDHIEREGRDTEHVSRTFPFLYIVETKTKYITSGRFHDSPLVAQGMIHDLIDRSLPLDERTRDRNEKLAKIARRYFTVNLKDRDKLGLEMISDRWVVTEVINLRETIS